MREREQASSILGHARLVFLFADCLLFSCFHFCLELLLPLGNGDLRTLAQVLIVLQESLAPSTEEKYIIIAFLGQELSLGDSLAFIKHIDDDQFIRLVLESEKLRDCLVSGDIHCWEVY